MQASVSLFCTYAPSKAPQWYRVNYGKRQHDLVILQLCPTYQSVHGPRDAGTDHG